MDLVGAIVGWTKKPPSAGNMFLQARLVWFDGGYEKLLLYRNVWETRSTVHNGQSMDTTGQLHVRCRPSVCSSLSIEALVTINPMDPARRPSRTAKP